MTESDLWKEIKKNIGGAGDFDRVESGSTSDGIPDVDYCIDGTNGHLELKYAENGVPKMRPSQIRWFKARAKAGDKLAFVFAKIVMDGRPKYMFYRADRIIDLANAKGFADWECLSNWVWYGAMNWSELIFLLKGGNPAYINKSLDSEESTHS